MTGDDIARVREVFGLNQVDIARFVDASTRTVEGWEYKGPKHIADGPWEVPLAALIDIAETDPPKALREYVRSRVLWAVARGGFKGVVVDLAARFLTEGHKETSAK